MFDQRCVNKVSRRFSLLLFLRLVFRVSLPFFFLQLPVCECPSALSQLNFWSLVYMVRVSFRWKHCLNLNCCFAIHDSISVWYFALRFLWEEIEYIKVSIWIYTCKASENFRNLQELSVSFESNIYIYIYVVSCNVIRFWNSAQFFQWRARQQKSQRLVMLQTVMLVTADGQISPESFDVTK